jgi:hypothetical protein
MTNRLSNHLTLFWVFVIFRLNAFAQGSVNIEYVAIDSVNQSFIGKEIRIDFKSSMENDSQFVNGHVPILALLRSRDTFSLKIKNESVKFTERWITYPDEALLRAQGFRSLYLNTPIQIYEMILEHIDTNSIHVSATIYDLDNSYSELDKKKLELEHNLRETAHEIINLDKQTIDIDARRTALEDKKWSLEREIRKLIREERNLDRDWIDKDKKKNRIERIVIDKSLIKGIMTKIN